MRILRSVMKTSVGVFTSRADAERAASALRESGVPDDRLGVLIPEDADRAAREIPTTDAEPPGIGRALGAVAGAAAGAAHGLQAGALAAVFVPGVGPVIALGIVGAAALGVAGYAIGGALDRGSRTGVPRDEAYVYEDALRRGRSLVFALTDDESSAGRARGVLAAHGAETVDSAREQWWIGLRDAERAQYTGGEFARDEPDFRRGYEAALTIGRDGRSWDEAAADLQDRYPDAWRGDAFRRGWERGQSTERRRRHAA